jgi:ceramide glucosyltransferase
MIHLAQYAGGAMLALGLFGLLTSTIFLGLVCTGVVRLRREAAAQERSLLERAVAGEDFLPGVTLMKPLHGAEPGLAENLRSFYRQDYFSLAARETQVSEARSGAPTSSAAPASVTGVEILFCARTEADAGLAVARQVAAEFPQIATRIVTSGEPWAPNAKVCSLTAMAKVAAHDLWVISDSDVHVTPDYLRRVVLPFADPKIGCVTCLYRGIAAEGGIWSRLEAAGMTIEMSSGVAAANLMEPMQFALGPTMAARRECVAEIGGFESMAEYCADDFVLGNEIAKHGHTVMLASAVIDHMVLNASFLESIKHQVRWMKSTRFSRPKGHFGTALTFATPFGLLAFAGALLLGHPVVACGSLLFALTGRMLQAWAVGRFVVQDTRLAKTMLLFPVRDFMGFCFWALSYTSRRILWRGEVYELLEEGRMRKA